MTDDVGHGVDEQVRGAMDECLIIDDVDAALARMTECGRSIVQDAAYLVRDAVQAFACKRRWKVVRYEAFLDWTLTATACERSITWLILDPLFPDELLSPQMTAVSTTRTGAHGFVVRDGDMPPLSRGGEVGIIDDAAATGSTALFVARTVHASGGSPLRFRFCASTAFGRQRVLRAFRAATWHDYVGGSWTIMHLRDGCPYLPFSGRRWAMVSDASNEETLIDPRMPATDVIGSVWHTLTPVGPIAKAIHHARSLVVQRLSDELGRPAVVADLPRLGRGVPALAHDGSHVTKGSSLESLHSK